MSEKIDGKTAQGQGLLPCPFCCSLDVVTMFDTIARSRYGTCNSCEARGPAVVPNAPESQRIAVDWWNQRTPTAQSEPARDVEEAAGRDPVAEVGEFGGVTFFKSLDPNTLLFTRPWLDSEIEMARMQAAEMAEHFKEAPSAQQQPESGS